MDGYFPPLTAALSEAAYWQASPMSAPSTMLVEDPERLLGDADLVVCTKAPSPR